MIAQLCQHCEKTLATADLGLCASCHAKNTVRSLYEPRPTDTPELLARIAYYRERAKKGLDLFEEISTPPQANRLRGKGYHHSERRDEGR